MAEKDHAALLLALGAPKMAAKGGDEESAEKGSDPTAQDILDAVKSNDAAGLAAALKRFVSKCMAEYDSEEEAPESEG